ncbi:MAG: CehA/McbA family metallohydrolase [Infirmifilum sp.]
MDTLNAKPILEYEFSGEAGPEKRLGFQYLDFSVPESSCTLEVEYDYKGLGPGEVTIDIGLFEPGEIELAEGMKSFRGWSGSTKRKFYVSRAWATPGYLPGDVKPGTWKVILGFYKIPERGVAYSVRVRVYRECFDASKKPNVVEKRKSYRGWVKGDLHMHSVHSDGDSTLYEIAELAHSMGLDFVSVTDHNTVSQIAELDWSSAYINNVLFIRGVEVTTYKGHMNVYGASEVPDFRLSTRADLERIVSYLKSKNFFLSVNHPKPLGPDWEFGDMSFADAVEVFHSVWEFNNHVSLRKWDELLQKGLRIGLIGGSDAHEMKGKASLLLPGVPTTWVYVDELSEPGVLAGLRSQKVFVSESVQGPKLFLKAFSGGREYGLGETIDSGDVKLAVQVEGAEGQYLRLISQGEVIATEKVNSGIFARKFNLNMKGAYVRAEVLKEVADLGDPYHPDNIISVLSSPIYLNI